ncbi:unnamed protein product [Amoebophrya sp. A120]|nr:unnamed protein product [Amoebophrya sp. A120]|eukprot:GSA120T00000347001.1
MWVAGVNTRRPVELFLYFRRSCLHATRRAATTSAVILGPLPQRITTQALTFHRFAPSSTPARFFSHHVSGTIGRAARNARASYGGTILNTSTSFFKQSLTLGHLRGALLRPSIGRTTSSPPARARGIASQAYLFVKTRLVPNLFYFQRHGCGARSRRFFTGSGSFRSSTSPSAASGRTTASAKRSFTRMTIPCRNGDQQEQLSLCERFWAWTTKAEPERARWSQDWWLDGLLKCTVFAITGTSSVTLVRPALAKVGLVGSLKDGPNSYRVLSIFLVSPVYTLILLTVGTLAGRHTYFAKMAQKMWRRFLPARWVDKMLCPPACVLKKTGAPPGPAGGAGGGGGRATTTSVASGAGPRGSGALADKIK